MKGWLLQTHFAEEGDFNFKTVVNLLSDKEEPLATKNPNKCRPCRFNESCKWKPGFSPTAKLPS